MNTTSPLGSISAALSCRSSPKRVSSGEERGARTAAGNRAYDVPKKVYVMAGIPCPSTLLTSQVRIIPQTITLHIINGGIIYALQDGKKLVRCSV